MACVRLKLRQYPFNCGPPIVCLCYALMILFLFQVQNIKKTLKTTQQCDMDEQMVTESSAAEKPAKKSSKTKG